MDRTIDLGVISPWKYYLFLATTLGATVGVLTPASGSMGRHLFQWQAQSVLAFALCIFAHGLLLRRMRRPGARLCLSGLVGSLLYAAPSLILDIGFGIDALPEDVRAWRAAWLDELSGSLVPVCLVWTAANLPWLGGLRIAVGPATLSSPREPDSSEVSAPGRIDPPAFMNLVPEPLRGEVRYLKSELQYLRVVTEAGESLILYSLRQAVEDQSEVPGIQTHRSYWVARNAIRGMIPAGRQAELELVDGTRIPVSRARVAEVRRHLDELPAAA